MLLSRMSESGKLGSHTQGYADQLQNQMNTIEENLPKGSEGEGSDVLDIPSYAAKLKTDTTSSRHRKNDLSEQFDDITISAVNQPDDEKLGSSGDKAYAIAKDFDPPSNTYQYPSFQLKDVTEVEPKHRFANPNHLAFQPPEDYGVIIPPTRASSSMYYNASPFEHHYPRYDMHMPPGGEPVFYSYSYPSHAHPMAPTTANLMPPPPPACTPSSTDSRKHRREISDNVPMGHRRTNTSGDSEQTKGHERDRDNETEVDVMAPIQEGQIPVSPAGSAPGGSLSGSYYYHGFPHVPYGAFNPPPPPPTYDITSSHSDSGASYNTGHSASMMLAYMQSNSLRSSPKSGYTDMPGSYPMHPNWHPGFGGMGHYDYQQPFTERTKTQDGNDDSSGSHHRKESSLGSFLATTGIFEDVFHEMEGPDDGYKSAPENIEENTIQASTEPIATANMARSLSEDNFFKQFYKAIHEDDDNPVLTTTSAAQPKPSTDATVPSACLPVEARFEANMASTLSAPKLIMKQTSGGEANRHRRKCAVELCPNRVVQGGLCISHGAKRKTCNYPGCTKNVKKQGKCSAHGPERKRCEAEGCTKVAVQGGKCISHGAKKKGCGVEGCVKQSIMGGMCKKHFDEHNGVVKVRSVRKKRGATGAENPGAHHERGLSVFTEQNMADRIINSASPIEFSREAI